MQTPPWLKPGSKIRIVAPAGKIDDKCILQAAGWLLEQGYTVEMGEHCKGRHFQYSGTDGERTSDLQSALDDPGAVAIICARGGNGTIRILDNLDFNGFRKHPKWVVGYSDVTVLHNRLHQLGIKSLHGVMCSHFLDENGLPTESLQSMMRILTGEKVKYSFPGNFMYRPGKVSGILVGGNLSMIYSLAGTPYDLDTSGKILFIEDTGEYLYHIDRMMVSLRLSGKLGNLAGLVVGQFSDVKDNDEPFGKTVEEIVLDAVRGYNFPMCFGFPAGHDQPNQALVLGATWKLTVAAENCSLQMT